MKRPVTICGSCGQVIEPGDEPKHEHPRVSIERVIYCGAILFLLWLVFR